MTDHADTIRRALRKVGWQESFKALDALLAERQQVQQEREDVISEIGEYSEGLAPNDLIGAVEWLIAEETKQRIQRQQAQEERDTEHRLALEYLDEIKSLRAERRQAQEEREAYAQAAAHYKQQAAERHTEIARLKSTSPLLRIDELEAVVKQDARINESLRRDLRQAIDALQEIAQLAQRFHPIAGYQYDASPANIARAALVKLEEKP